MNTTSEPIAGASRITVEQVNYRGWQNAYHLSNGTIEIVVVPEIARIMRFAFVNGPNLFWENPNEFGKPGDTTQWRNFGGDKPWPWPQDDWPKWYHRDSNWPPPPEAEQMPQDAKITGDGVLRLTSPVLAHTGLQITRDIHMPETGSRLTIVTKVERVEDGYDFPVGAWTITQTPFVVGQIVAHLRPGESTLAEGWKSLSGNDLFTAVKRSADGASLAVTFDRQAKSGRKLGFDGDAISGMVGDTLLRVGAESPGAKAWAWRPGERGQMYVSDGGTPYIEWEFTSPLKRLKKGESAELVTTYEATVPK